MSEVPAMTGGTLVTGSATGLTVADRYRLDQMVGSGGAAEVYAAEDLVLHRAVAVKLFRGETELTDAERIESEITTLARLRHPGIVTIFDAGLTQRGDTLGRPFIAMELITGPTLRRRLTDGPMTADEVAVLARDLAATLAYLHGEGVVHRDVKPANVLLDCGIGTPFCAKLSDFGLAIAADAARITVAGRLVGTANYVAPEQLKGEAVGAAADIYALGLVLLEALTGTPAFPGHGVEAAMPRLHRDPAVPGWVPQEWAALIGAMTAKDPAARPSAPEVLRQVPSGLRFSAPAVLDPGPPTELSGPPTVSTILARPEGFTTEVLTDVMVGRRRWWRWPALVALLGAAAVTLLLVLGAHSAPGRTGPTAPSATRSAAARPSAQPSPTVASVGPTATAPKAAAPTPSRTARATAKPSATRSPVKVTAAPATHGKAKGRHKGKGR